MTNEDIGIITKNRFKTVVKKKTENLALKELNKLKISDSKSSYLKSSSFKASSYLVDSRFTKSEAQLLFRLRSKTVNLKVNFPKMYQDNLCKMCKLFPESQAHLLQCPEIVPS